jgi:hypothetical protein
MNSFAADLHGCTDFRNVILSGVKYPFDLE